MCEASAPTVLPRAHFAAALAVVIAVAATLRLYGLDLQSLWLDELVSATWAQVGSLRELFDQFRWRDEVHPPGYHVIQYFFQRLLGEDPAAIRMSSALGGLLAVLALAKLGRDLFEQRTALLAATLMAVGWCPVYYSQDARPYALLMLAATLLVITLERVTRTAPITLPRRIGEVAACAASACFCAYLHYFGLAFAALMLAFYLFREAAGGGAVRPLLGVAFMSALGYALWLPVAVGQLRRSQVGGLSEPGWQFFARFGSMAFNRSLWLAAACGLLIVWVLADYVLRSHVRKDRGVRAPELMLAVWGVLPVVVAFAVAQVASVVKLYALLFVLPALLMLLARAVTRLTSGMGPVAFVAMTMIVGGAGVTDLVVRQQYYTKLTKEEFRQATRTVVDAQRGDEIQVVVAYAPWGWFIDRYFDYYFERFGSPTRVKLALGDTLNQDKLTELRERPETSEWWLLYRTFENPAAIIARFKGEFEVAEDARWRGTGVVRFVRRKDEGQPRGERGRTHGTHSGAGVYLIDEAGQAVFRQVPGPNRTRSAQRVAFRFQCIRPSG